MKLLDDLATDLKILVKDYHKEADLLRDENQYELKVIHEVEKELEDYYKIYRHIKHGEDIRGSQSDKLKELNDDEKKRLIILVNHCKQISEVIRSLIEINKKSYSTLETMKQHAEKAFAIIYNLKKAPDFRTYIAMLSQIIEIIIYIDNQDNQMEDYRAKLESVKVKRMKFLEDLEDKKHKILKGLYKDEKETHKLKKDSEDDFEELEHNLAA